MHPIPASSPFARLPVRESPGHPPRSDGGIDLAMLRGRGTLDADDGHATVLWLVLRGHVDVEAQEGDFVLGPRQWIALDRESSPRAVLGRDALLLAVGIGPGHQRGIPADPTRSMVFPGRGRMAPGVRGLALRMWRKHAAQAAPTQAGRPLIAMEELGAFLVALQAELIEGIGRCPGHSRRRKQQVLLRMQRARLCLEGQVGNGLRIAELARHTNFSPWYFSKVFHAVYGIGPLQFAARMRLERAFRLLATTRLPVTEVSVACGFDNPCSFARAFRARFGMTASEHRLRSVGGHASVPEDCPRIPWQRRVRSVR